MAKSNAARRREHLQTAREKAAQMRAEERRRQRRQRAFMIAGSAVGFLAVVAVIVVVGISSKPKAKPAGERAVASPAVVSALTSVPAATITAVGAGDDQSGPKATTSTDAPLTADGKPEVLFVGAEYCPYCAAERWPLVQALSRFGTFSGLKSIQSSSTDVYPSTATFSFYGSTYSSQYLTLTAKENEDGAGKELETLSDSQTALWARYTNRSFPFADLGGKYYLPGPAFSPQILHGLTDEEITNKLSNPSDPVTKAIIGSANAITAALCKVTNSTPSAVCTAPGVLAAASSLS